MDIFIRVIPFEERIRWSMFKAAVQYKASLKKIANRANWSRSRVWAMIFDPAAPVYIKEVGVWFHVVNPNLHVDLKFKRIERDHGPTQRGDTVGDHHQEAGVQDPQPA